MLHLNSQFKKSLCSLLFALLVLHLSHPVLADEFDYKHGFAFLSEPALDEGFDHLGYAEPNAPKGGRIRIPQMGTWDSFNLISAKGRLAAGLGFWGRDTNLLWDTLLVPALDEPATYYCLLAEGLAIADDQSWVAFKLRKEARWHDGKNITTKDVAFSFKSFKNDASPTIRSSFRPYTLEVINEYEFRFFIPEYLRNDPSVIFTLGGIPLLPAHYWQERDITKTTVEPPLGSGPYKIGRYSVGRWIEYDRVENYWGSELAVRKGLFNFDIVKYDYFRDDQIQTEAIKGQVVDVREETVPRTWKDSYDIPAFNQGYMKKERHQLLKPAGLWWPIFWNMEQPRFQDIRVRKALWLLRDEVWSGERSYGFFGHATSFFHDSELASTGLPSALELKLLEPLRGQVPETIFTQAYEPQPNAGAGWSRENIVEAAALLEEAGWIIKDDELVHSKTAEPFHIRFVAVSPSLASSFVPYAKLLEKLGISSSIKAPEISNWLYRMQSGDFDGGAIWFLPTNIPTLTITNSFSSKEADKAYGSNWSNLKDPAIDVLIKSIADATRWDEYVAAIRAFDRVMLHNFYWQPMMSNTHRALAFWDKFGRPDHGRLRRLALVDNWWWDEEKAARVNSFTGGDN